MSQDAAAFIRANLHIVEPPFAPGVRLYQAQRASGLRRLIGDDAPPPYWAYTWAGGAVLVSHLQAYPEIVRGRRVLDLGAGSGLVGIAAARMGASSVMAAEIDPHGVVAIGLNAALNGVTISVLAGDVLSEPPADVDLVLVGDLFYAPGLAARTLACLDRYVAAGAQVLIGDPGRDDLPLARLERVADYFVPDFGDAAGRVAKSSGVFALVSPPSSSSAEPT